MMMGNNEDGNDDDDDDDDGDGDGDDDGSDDGVGRGGGCEGDGDERFDRGVWCHRRGRRGTEVSNQKANGMAAAYCVP